MWEGGEAVGGGGAAVWAVGEAVRGGGETWGWGGACRAGGWREVAGLFEEGLGSAGKLGPGVWELWGSSAELGWSWG